jgi:hypothetical protein
MKRWTRVFKPKKHDQRAAEKKEVKAWLYAKREADAKKATKKRKS